MENGAEIAAALKGRKSTTVNETEEEIERTPVRA
jgi:hypothetical protein